MQQVADPRIADLVKAGRLRVALGLGSPALAIRHPATGELIGAALDLGRALAARIGVELVPVEYPRPGAIMEGVHTNAWDVTFLVIAPDRAAEGDFSCPYMQSDFTYLLPAGSSIRSVADADQPGIRIAVARGDASDLYLSKTLTRAELVRADSLAAALDLVRTAQADAYAAGRVPLLALADKLPGSCVLQDGFGVISYAALVPKGRTGLLAYLSEFIEEAKASGLVRQIIERAGLHGVQVSP
jgi:polar amino acid transport system substrate-binding protein